VRDVSVTGPIVNANANGGKLDNHRCSSTLAQVRRRDQRRREQVLGRHGRRRRARHELCGPASCTPAPAWAVASTTVRRAATAASAAGGPATSTSARPPARGGWRLHLCREPPMEPSAAARTSSRATPPRRS
jgi:hypothetical protein